MTANFTRDLQRFLKNSFFLTFFFFVRAFRAFRGECFNAHLPTTSRKFNMTDINNLITNATLSEMLPVGMLASGGVIAFAMSAVANRKRGLPGWEAFHYERISDAEFEITGGVVALVGGVKKWPGPHDTLTISESEILEELNQHVVADAQTVTQTSAMPDIAAGKAKVNPGATQYLQVVFAMPEDEIGRQRILKAFHLHADFFGAKVQTCSLLE